jgi:hypothetical protein
MQFLKMAKGQLSLSADRVINAKETVFISYSRNDEVYVTKLAEWLEGHGVSIWYDHDIDYGTRWEAEIMNRLNDSTTIVAVMSKSARDSQWVIREIDLARQMGKKILPLLLESDGMIDQLSDLQWENVTGGRTPRLNFCQKLPGYLVSERDIINEFSPEQHLIANRIISNWMGNREKEKIDPVVAALQAELIRVGLDPGSIDGVLGEKTKKAVREFQMRRCQMIADGIPGPLTWTVLVHSSLGDLAPDSTFKIPGVS